MPIHLRRSGCAELKGMAGVCETRREPELKKASRQVFVREMLPPSDLSRCPRRFGAAMPCLDALKIPKFYKILHHIKFLNTCMKY